MDARNVLDAIKQEKKEEKAIKSRQRRQRQKLKRKTYQENLERQNEELREQVPSKNVFLYQPIVAIDISRKFEILLT